MDVVESGSILPENTVGVSDIVSAGTEQWSNLGKSAIPRHFVGIGLSQLPGVGRCQDRVHISKNTDIWQLNTYGVAVHTVETIPGPQMSSQPGRETCDEFVSTSCPFLPVFVYINELRILRSRTESFSSTDPIDSRYNDTRQVYPPLFRVRDFSYPYSKQHRAKSSVVRAYYSTTGTGTSYRLMPGTFPVSRRARGPLEGVR